MRLGQNKRILVLPIVLMIVLSIIGVSVAHWSDLIKINGIVKMGSLTAAFDYVEGPTVDEWWLNKSSGQLVAGEYLGKEVGETIVTRKELIIDAHTGKKGYKRLQINITNGYPSYRAHVTFKLTNIGTSPVVFINYTVIPGPGLAWVGTWDGGLSGDIIDAATEDKLFNVDIVNFVGYQLDPCNSTKGEIDIHIKQPAEECHTYTFEVELWAVNWPLIVD